MSQLIESQPTDRRATITIGVLSVAIPLVVAVLLFLPQTGKLGDFDVSFLPHLNAVLNSATALLLVVGYVMIRTGRKQYHQTAMVSAFVLSSFFLVSYVLYHFQAPSTRFGDVNADGVVDAMELASVGPMRYIYLALLLSHILLATVIVPFVLFSIYFAATKRFEKHKKLSRWTFPMWLYVAVTGVLVYLMISPYYAH
ncbi:MAG: DUF420 domain-containing protein [Catalinimonas sp.]